MQLTKWEHEPYMNIKGEGHSVALVQGISDSHLQISFP